MTQRKKCTLLLLALMGFGFTQAALAAGKEYTDEICANIAEEDGYDYSLYIQAFNKCYISEDGQRFYDKDDPTDKANEPALVFKNPVE